MLTLISIAQPNNGTLVRGTRHPLEPLSAEEVREAVDLLKREGKVTSTTRFVSVSLKEPDKALVHHPRADEPPPRKAEAILFDNAKNACYEASLSLTEDALLSWKHVPGVQPTMTSDEQVECEQAVLNSPEFKIKLKEHTGVDDTSLVMVDIWSAGNYGEPEDRTRRLARPLCFLRTDPTDNGYVRPIEGLRPVVELEHDGGRSHRGLRPLADPSRQGQLCGRPRRSVPNRHQAVGDHPALRTELRGGRPSGLVAEVEVRHRLQRPRGADAPSPPLPRPGPRAIRPLSGLLDRDGGPLRRSRSVAEARKNAFDVGEYGMGMCANSLGLGCDCLGLIHYFDAISATAEARR